MFRVFVGTGGRAALEAGAGGAGFAVAGGDGDKFHHVEGDVFVTARCPWRGQEVGPCESLQDCKEILAVWAPIESGGVRSLSSFPPYVSMSTYATRPTMRSVGARSTGTRNSETAVLATAGRRTRVSSLRSHSE